MSKTEFVALIVRMVGLLLFAQLLPSVGFALQHYFIVGALEPTDGWLATTLLVCWVTASLCMMTFPELVAGNWLTRHGEQPLAFHWTRGGTESVALTLIGLFFALQGIFDTSYNIVRTFSIYIYDQQYGLASSIGATLATQTFPGLFVGTFKVLVGTWLLMGAAGVRGLLRFLRDYGASAVESDRQT
jgi:hypothetical protein